jgi:hypothetical protein
MSSPQNPKIMVIISGAVAVLGVAMAGFLTMSAAPEQPSAQVLVEAHPQVPSASSPVEAVTKAPRELAGSPAPESGRAAKPAPPKPNRMARDLEREKIWRALGRKHGLEPAAPGSAAPSEAAASLLPALKSEYVREAIREQLVPVAVDCYNTVLTSEDAAASGSLVFEFTIIGDEEVGGVVEAVELGEDSTFESEFLRECLLESLLAVTFEPPSDGGRVEVRYPMTFTPD